MTNQTTLHETHLDQLLGVAIEMDADERARFLDSDAVPKELREELLELIAAASASSPLDVIPLNLVSTAAALLQRHDSHNLIATGQRIGNYRLLRLIGEGGMASVWLADRDDGAFSHQVAVKCLKTGLATPESRARFLREQQILAQLKHPNIARLYDAGISDDGLPYIVMEWVDGTSLTQYCDDRRLSLNLRVQLFQKVTAVVAFAHQNLIVHRDLKPANILIGNDGEPKLLDFGIAKSLNEDTVPMTRTGLHLLTPEYAAPEQFSCGVITTATDVYALGAVLYELMSGLRPRIYIPGHAVDTTTPVTAPSEALKRAPRTLRPEQLATLRHTVPERLRRSIRGDLDTIALKALQNEPGRRYASAQALSDDIERYLQQQPIKARKDAWTYRTGKFLKRHALGVALFTIVIVLLLAATGISLYQAQRAETQTQRAQAEAKRALAVEGFLTNLFEASDSGLPRDKVPSTETLLEDGIKRVQEEFKDAPEVKLRLLRLLGQIQANLGFYDSAETLLSQAVAIADSTLSPATETWLQVHTAWAILLEHRSHIEQSENYLTASIAEHRSNGARDNTTLANALNALGNIYRQRDHFDEAIAIAREALAMSQRLLGEHHVLVQKATERLGRALIDARRLDEAQTTLRANINLSRDLYGEYQAQFATSLILLAEVLTEVGKTGESEQLARQAVAINESVYTQPNRNFVGALIVLGKLLLDQNNYAQAKPIFERALKMQTALDGSDNAVMSDILYSLADTAFGEEDYPKAERLKRQSLELTRKHYGPRNSRVAVTLATLGQILTAQKRYKEAMEAVEEAVAIQRESYGDQSQPYSYTLLQLSFIEIKTGNAQRALEHIETAQPILKSFADTNHRNNYLTIIVKATALNDLSRYEEAKQLLLLIMEPMRLLIADSLPMFCEALTELGRAHSGLGESGAARSTWNEALTLLRSDPTSNPVNVKELEGLIQKLK